jgi:hypothetical protein
MFVEQQYPITLVEVEQQFLLVAPANQGADGTNSSLTACGTTYTATGGGGGGASSTPAAPTRVGRPGGSGGGGAGNRSSRRFRYRYRKRIKQGQWIVATESTI